MATARLDQGLLARIAKKQKKTLKSVREQVSRLASRLGMPSEGAILVLASRCGVGIASRIRGLPPSLQQQVNTALMAGASGGRSSAVARRTAEERRQPDRVALPIDDLLTDDELRSRCGDLLRRRRHLDRAVREAMTVLENRLRSRTGLDKGQERSRVGLVAKALHPDSGMLRVSVERDEQQGVHDFCKGLIEMYGNPIHHSLRDDVTLEQAVWVCGAVNLMLALLDKATVREGWGVRRT